MFNKEKIRELYPEAENLMISPMLTWKLPPEKQNMLSEVCLNGDYFLQEKLDGSLYMFVKTDNYSYLFGRTVSKTTGLLTEKGGNIPHIADAFKDLPAGTIILGEIYVPGGISKDVTHIMGCLPEEAIKRQNKEGFIHYYCYDILAYEGISLLNEGAETRYKILEAIWKLHSFDSYDFLRLAVKVEENLEAELSRILKEGGEGVVLKKRNAPYSPGKRPAWHTIKCKQMDTADLIITRAINPTREYSGKDIESWPYWERDLGEGRTELTNICRYEEQEDGWIAVTKPYFLGWKTSIGVGAYDEDGQLIEIGTVSSGLTDEMKAGLANSPEQYIGYVCALDCMSIDKKEKTLRHPAFNCMRYDKNPHECLMKEIF